jgi:hypothetical protein
MSQKIPDASGASVPASPYELMKQLRAAEKEHNKTHAGQQKENRARKMDLQREALELRLLALEDYSGCPEGTRRARAHEDRVHMETEDILSGQLEAYYKEQLADSFRNNLRLMAEERQRQEDQQREKKREFAEARRQAVLDRIRKKKKEEEELLRQTELRTQMIEADNLRILRVCSVVKCCAMQARPSV